MNSRKLNEGLIIYTFYNLVNVYLGKQLNSGDMPHFVVSHLGLSCLYMSFFAWIQPVPQVRTLSFRLAMPLPYILYYKLLELILIRDQ